MTSKLYRSILTLLAATLLAPTGHAQVPDPGLLYYPETILLNAQVVSMADGGVNTGTGPGYQAVAVRDGRVFRLGSDAGRPAAYRRRQHPGAAIRRTADRSFRRR